MEIKTISEKMLAQSNRMTQSPLFVIQVDRKAYGDSSWCSEAERKEDCDIDLLCEKCTKIYDDGDGSGEVPDYCAECDDDCFVWYNVEDEFDLTAGVFLTAEACEEHIRLNAYHYDNPRSFAIGCWRNEEMQTVLKHIVSLAGDVPSHYEIR